MGDKKKNCGRFVIVISVALLSLSLFTLSLDVLSRAASTAAWIIAFYLIDRWFKTDFTLFHYGIVTVMSIASNLLFPLYFVWPQYDKVLHFTLPFLFSIIVFHLVNKLNLSLRYKLLFTFFIVVGTSGLFEISEFLLDQVTDLKLQGVYQWQYSGEDGVDKLALTLDKNTDTMIDMMLGTVGAGLFVLWMALRRKKKV